MVNTTAITQSADIAQSLQALLGISRTFAIILLTIITAWVLVWKGLAMWKSAKKNHIVWFVIFLIIGGAFLGILEILYIYVFADIDKRLKSSKKSSSKSKLKKLKKRK